MEVSTVVVDNGSYTIRAGIGGESEPQTIIPTIIGRQSKGLLPGSKDVYVGSEVYNQQEITFKSPYENGVISNFEDMERIWGRFYKADTSRNRDDGGSGIGLSIVKAIMNNYQNDYGVINKENGVEFYFELDKNL